MKRQLRPICFAVLLIAFILLGCEQDTRISIDGNNPPKFRLKGSGKAYFIRVLKSPAPESEVTGNEGGIWQIDPDESIRNTNISQYPEIRYGEVPPGFIQRIPKIGTAPSLEDGQEYLLLVPTYNANFEVLRFKIEKSKSIEVH